MIKCCKQRFRANEVKKWFWINPTRKVDRRPSSNWGNKKNKWMETINSKRASPEHEEEEEHRHGNKRATMLTEKFQSFIIGDFRDVFACFRFLRHDFEQCRNTTFSDRPKELFSIAVDCISNATIGQRVLHVIGIRSEIVVQNVVSTRMSQG